MAGAKRAIININLGQCGAQISDSLWELFCLEHDVKLDGKIRQKNRRNLDLSTNSIYFEECPNGKYVPRSVIFDTEPSVVDVIRTGRRRNLFRPDCLISGKEDAGNVFARGYYTLADDMKDLVLDRIRKVAEACCGIQGFSIVRSYGGGTGSGFGSALLGILREDYPKLTQIEVAAVPSGHFSTAVVEPYNAVFSTHESLMNSDCALFFDNESLYNMMSRKLNYHSPTYKDINRMIAQVISAMTASLRFSAMLKIDLTDVQTNLVPYPRLHFPIASISPIFPRGSLTYNEKEMTCAKMTKNLFNKDHFGLLVDPSNGKYMSCCITYRGQVVPKEINSTIHSIKRSRSIAFVDWCPTGFKIGINSARMIIPKGLALEPANMSAVMLANSTSINDFWMALNRKYDLMNNKRSFWHHYIQEGMPEEDFREFREDLAALELDYIEVAEDTVEGFPEPLIEDGADDIPPEGYLDIPVEVDEEDPDRPLGRLDNIDEMGPSPDDLGDNPDDRHEEPTDE